METRKRVALMLVIIMLLNVICPYIPLFNNIAFAGSGVLEEHPLIINNLGITTKGTNRVLKVEIALVSEAVINGFDMQFKINTDKITPCNKNTGAPNTTLALIMQQSDYYGGTLQIKSYDKSTNTFHFTATEPAGGTDIVENGYIPGELGDPAIDENGAGYPAYYPVLTLSFKIVDNTITEDNIPLDLFELVPITVGLPTGLKVNFNNESNIRVSKDVTLGGKGFAEAEKEIEKIEVKQKPSNINYDHGDVIKLDGGIITVTYSDKSTAEVNMTESDISILSGTTANINNKNVTINYKGKTCSFDINVNDPITSLEVSKQMSKVEYNHDNDFDFTGLELIATKKSGATEKLTKESSGVTVSETKANVNSPNFNKTSTENIIPVRGTQKIIFTYQGKTATQSVVVNDKIKEISIATQPNKSIYKYNEALDLSGAVVKVILESGDVSNIQLPDGMVEVLGYKSTTINQKQKLNVKVGEKELIGAIEVEVYDYIVKTELIEPNNASYKYGDELNLTGGSLKLTWKSGKVTNVKLSETEVTGYNKNEPKIQTLNVKYEANYQLTDKVIKETFTHTFEVEVINTVKNIEIIPPTKKTYNHGEELNLTGSNIKVIYADDNNKTVKLTKEMIKESDNLTSVNMSPSNYDSTNKVNKILKITYEEDGKKQVQDYPITIVNDVKQISIQTSPKKEYNVKEELDKGIGTITVKRAVGSDEIIALNDNRVQIEGFKNDKEYTNLSITVKFTENEITKSTTYTVNVKDTVTSIKINKTPNKTIYKYGEELNVTDGTIEVTKGSGTTTVSIEPNMVTEEDGTAFDNKKLGTRNLKVTYGGKETTYSITIKDYVTGIKVVPDKVESEYGKTLEEIIKEKNIKYIVTYAQANDKKEETLTADMVKNFNNTTITEQKLDVSYIDKDVDSYTNNSNFTAKLSITLKDKIDSIEIKAPTKNKYNHGDVLNLSGGTIIVKSKSGAQKNVTMTSDMIKENENIVNMSPDADSFGPDKTLQKTLKITYTEDGVTGTIDYPITIVNDIREIKIHSSNHKTDYNVKDNLDTTNLEILVTRAVGIPEVIKMQSNNIIVEGFDSSKAVTGQKLTVKYTENNITKQTEYTVNIVNGVKEITIIAPTKTEYVHGDKLDLSTGKIDVKYSDDTTNQKNITYVMVTETDTKIAVNMSPEVSKYQNNKLTKSLTITYTEGTVTKSITYEITIKNPIESIKIGNSPKTTYNLNDNINNIGGTIIVTRKAGNEEIVNIEDNMVTGLDTKTAGVNKIATVKYTEDGITKETTYKFEVKDNIQSITITPPTKNKYNHGEELDLNGGKITIHYASGQTSDTTLEKNMIKEIDGKEVNMNPDVTAFNSNTILSKTLKISYTNDGKTGTVDYPITIVNDIRKIEIHSKNHKVEYNVNDELDTTNLEILVTRAVGDATVIVMPNENIKIEGFNSSIDKESLTLTVKYTENEIEKSTTYNISVKDSIKSITLKSQPNKVKYKYGENIELDGATIEVVKGSETSTIPVTSNMISTYNPNILGEQQLTVTHNGIQTIDKIIVTVVDYITGIELTPPTKNEYQLNEDLSLDGGYVKPIMASGQTAENVKLTSQMIKNIFDKQKAGPQELTVEYEGFTKKFTVTVADYITKIEMKNTPKTEYQYGEDLDVTNGSIEVSYALGSVSTVNITKDMVKESNGSEFNSNVTFETGKTTYDKNLKVTYNGFETTYKVTIINTLNDIEIQGESQKQYKVNDKFQENLSILVKRATGEPEAIRVTKEMVTGFDTSTPGTKEITIKYKENNIEKEIKYQIEVIDEITSIDLKGEPKTQYIYNEEFKTDNLNLILHKTTGEEEISVTSEMIKGYNKTKVDEEQIVTIEYNGQIVKRLTVKVSDVLNSIEWITKPKTSYVIDESLDVTNGKIKAIYISGKVEEINLETNMVIDFNSSTKGDKTLHVKYGEKELTYDITVTDKVNSISIKDTPKTEYLYGDELKAQGTIEIEKASGERETINITPEMIVGYNKNQLGKQKVTIEYGGKQTTFEINVSDYVKDVLITPPSKTNYQYGEELDISGGKIQKIMASTPEKSENIEMTVNMITGYNKELLGNQTLTITYQENGKDYTKTFVVNISDKISKIELINNGFKTEYLYGENLDLSKLSFKVTYLSGNTENIQVTNSMVSGYNLHKLGTQNVQFSYQGTTDSINVNVSDYITDIILTPPDKVKYQIEETLSLEGGKIIEKFASGRNGTTVELTSGMVNGFDSNTPGTKTITVTYEKEGKTFQKQFQVVVINTITNITIIPPTKVDYKYGETLNLVGGKIILDLKDETQKELPITQNMISGYNSKLPGRQVVTVTYIDEEGNKFENYFTVTVGEDYIVNTIFQTPNKTTYQLGETIDLEGGYIYDIYASGKHGNKILLTENMITGFDNRTPGEKVITVKYEEKEYTYKVKVQDKLLGIAIEKLPNKVEYKKGENLDISGGKLTLIYQSGENKIINITKEMVNGYNKNEEGMQIITITYQEFKAEYMISVEKEQTVPVTPVQPEQPTTPNKPVTPEKQEKPTYSKPNNNSNNMSNNQIQNNVNQETEKEEQKNNLDKNDSNIPPVIGNINNVPPTDGGNNGFLQGLLAGIIGTLTLAGIMLLILLYVRERKNVKIYIEEGNERVLVGKEKLSRTNTTLNLNKYYDKYKEDEYSVVLSKRISKKLDQEKVKLVVHDKKESFVVDYKKDACTYRT